MNAQLISALPVSFDAYIRHGWRLVPIPSGTKGPQKADWNKIENCLTNSAAIPEGYGVGLAHAYSGTMALDIDDYPQAEAMLAQQGINLNSLITAPDAVTIDSGNPGHGKLIYAMPFGLTLPSKKITYKQDGINKVAFELRCASSNGLTVQDLLPPSRHPSGTTYQWGGNGNWQRLPTIPLELLTIWQAMIEQDAMPIVKTGNPIDASWDDIRNALYTISPDCSHDEWVHCGMALHSTQDDQGLFLWDEWSSQSTTKYKGKQEIITRWRSFKPDNGITIGTLFHIASEYGYKRPTPNVNDLFSAVGEVKKPLSIIDGLRAPPPEMNMSLWPEIIATRANELSYQIGCDPLVPLMAGVAAICGAVDSRMRLQLMPKYKVPPVLWIMTIGAPADKKTPGSRPMMEILGKLEKEDLPAFKGRMLSYEAQERMYAESKKAYLDAAGNPVHMVNNGLVDMEMLPSVAQEPPKKPVPKRLTVSDITSQKLVHQAADRPEGFLCYLDEMNSWIHKMVDSKSGEDRSCWTQAYESQSYTMDRVGAGFMHCDPLSVSVYGNVQPKVFRKYIDGLNIDGMLQRFIPVILSGKYDAVPNSVPDYMTNIDAWETLVRNVHDLEPKTYTLSHGATEAFREYQVWFHQSKNDERILASDDIFQTAFGKLEGLTGRIALVNHIIESPHNSEVSASTMQNAINIVKTYVIPALRYTYSEIAGAMDKSVQVAIIEYIIRIADQQDKVTIRDLKRAAIRRMEGLNSQEQDRIVQESVDVLIADNWLALLEENKKSIVWAINPAIRNVDQEYKTSIIKAKQRQLDNARAIVLGRGIWIERRFAIGYKPEMDNLPE